MKDHPLRTTVVGSYPFPGWLELASWNLERFGETDRAELIDDAVTVAIRDQMDAGLEVITDGEQTRLDFNLSFYGFLQGIELESASPRRFGPPAHDQRGRHKVTGTLAAPRGLGTVEDFERLQRLAPPGPALKASVPGPYTLSGRLAPNAQYPDRLALTEALLPIVRRELEALVKAGCREITVDEPSMSCYAHREEPKGLVTIFNLDEFHLEMASREFAELELINLIAAQKDVAVGIIDVKSYYVETVQDVAERVRACLKHAPADRLSLAPDCGLSQTARWAAKPKLKNMVAGVRAVRKELGL